MSLHYPDMNLDVALALVSATLDGTNTLQKYAEYQKQIIHLDDRAYEEDTFAIASILGHTDIAELLLEKKPQTDIIDTLCFAIEHDMVPTVKMLVKKFDTNKSSHRADITRVFGTVIKLEVSPEVAEVILAEEAWWREQAYLYDWLCSALKRCQWQLVDTLWGVFAREHMKPGVVDIQEFLRGVVLHDRFFHITKQICEEFRTIVASPENCYPWRDQLLFWAMSNPGASNRSTMENPDATNLDTIRYLLDAYSKVPDRILRSAIGVQHVGAIDAILVKDTSLIESIPSGLEWRAIDQALHDRDWVPAFRLIHFGAKCESIPEAVRDELQECAIETFVTQRSSRDSVRVPACQWSQVRLLNFIAEMMSTRPLPNKPVFATNMWNARLWMTQLWTLFQLTLGVDFIQESRRLAATKYEDYDVDYDSEPDLYWY